jgi:hypothetical protein
LIGGDAIDNSVTFDPEAGALMVRFDDMESAIEGEDPSVVLNFNPRRTNRGDRDIARK